MGTSINGYELSGELTAQNAGFCQWGFCRKNDREYFIKEFLSPVYPAYSTDLSPKIIERKRKACESFFENKKAFYDALSRCRSGNNILIEDFFRAGPRYYIVTDKVYADGTDPVIISSLPREKKIAFIRSLLYSISCLHEAGLVHADLKPDNILLKKTTDGFYTAKIIDFDAGFLKGAIPNNLQGDFVYLSPEVFLRMNKEEVPVDEKADIFALGILLHQYWTGSLPTPGGDRRYAFEAVLNEDGVVLSNDLPEDLKENISRMLSKVPDERPGAAALLQQYRAKDPVRVSPVFKDNPTPPVSASPSPAPVGKGTAGKRTPGFHIPTDLD